MVGNDPQARSAEIKQFVANNELDKAAKRLLDFVEDFSTDSQREWEAIRSKSLM